MRLRIISIGRDRSGLFEPAFAEYAGRIRKHFPLDVLELKEAATAEREAEAVLERLAPGELLVCLDERGESFDSPALARRLGRWRDEGRRVAFAVGGDAGHGPAVRERATLVWSLSPLTLPHRLARVVLAEQLYRAITILRGEPYHK